MEEKRKRCQTAFIITVISLETRGGNQVCHNSIPTRVITKWVHQLDIKKMVGEPLDNSQMDTIIIKRESTLNIERSKFQREMQRLFQTTKCICCKLKPQRSCFTQDCSLFRQETPILFLNIKTKIPISPLTLVWLNKIIPLIVRNFILNSFL